MAQVDDPLTSIMATGTAVDIAAFLDDAVNGMALLDLSGRFRIVNPALSELLGYRQGELVGRSPAEITHPADRERSRATMELLLTGRVSADRVKKRYVRKDGSILSVIRTTTVLRSTIGEPIGLLTQVVNLTDMAEVEDRIRRSESRFRALVAHATDITILLDREGRMTYASPASLRLLGHCPADLEGRHALEFIHPEEMDLARSRLAGHLAGADVPQVAEYRVRHSDGSWRHAEITTTNLFGDPNVAALVLNIRDITEERQYQARLQASERRFRALVANSWDIVSLHDRDGRYLYCSPAVTRQLGYRPDELLGRDLFGCLHPDDTAAAEGFRTVAEGLRREAKLEYRLPHRDGSWRWMESIAHNRLDEPAIAAVVVTTRDVTNRRRRAAQQEAVAALTSAALEGGSVENLLGNTVDSVAAVLDVDRCVIATEWADGRVCTSFEAGHPDHGPATPSIPGEECSLSAAAHHRGGPVIWIRREVEPDAPGSRLPDGFSSGASTPIRPSSGAGGSLTVYSSRPRAFSRYEISFLEAVANVVASALTRRHIEEELRRQAMHDHLTGLPNRVLVKHQLTSALARLARRRGSVSVLFVDLDNFKLVNDTLGHSAGDAVVASTAIRITRSARTTDTVARLGGDEFVVICEDADDAAASALAERIRGAVSAPIELDTQTVSVTASIGYVVTDDPGVSADDLLAEADMAMYEAKQSGKDCSAVFAPQMRTRASEQLDAVSGIRLGLARDEFRLHYQPIVNARSGVMVGSEALLRWQHPTAGLLTPAQFIDYAESSGLILPLGEWILRTALRQSAQWRRSGVPSRVSINISALQLTGSDVVSVVKEALETSGAHPGDISLEVTESAVMADMDRATRAINSLKSLGLKVGMDDFGTGHSSLSHLARLPFDFVKIDRSFVDFGGDSRAAAMLEAVAALCRVLKLPTVAEGVETEQQRSHLERIGVAYLQGFLFGRAVPPEDLLLACTTADAAGR